MFFQQYALRNLPIISSDHGPIILDFEFLQPYRRRPFRFERMCVSHPTCENVNERAWSSQSTGSRASQLKHKLFRVRKELLTWNKEVFRRLDHDIYQNQIQIQVIFNSISSIDDVQAKIVVRKELKTLL